MVGGADRFKLSSKSAPKKENEKRCKAKLKRNHQHKHRAFKVLHFPLNVMSTRKIIDG